MLALRGRVGPLPLDFSTSSDLPGLPASVRLRRHVDLDEATRHAEAKCSGGTVAAVSLRFCDQLRKDPTLNLLSLSYS